MRDDLPIDIRVTESDFDVGAEIAALYRRASGSVGAVASFVGLVRDVAQDASDTTKASDATDAAVTGLYLEHYPGMTEQSIRRIVEQAGERWPLEDVVVIHRVGELSPRAQIVYVQVASGHRDAAFAAAEFVMDYLKTDAVLWKRENRETGARWVEATATDRTRRAGWGSERGA